MAAGLKVASPMWGPSSRLELLVLITPFFTMPATTVPTPGTPKVSSMMNSAASSALSYLEQTPENHQQHRTA